LVAAAANDPDVKILGDVYHMFKGGSGFNGLKMIRGNILEMMHMNDFPVIYRGRNKMIPTGFIPGRCSSDERNHF
jgi:sugar phosphate isomerase/epimerase